MDLLYFLRSAWLFVIGVVVAITGIFSLLLLPDAGPVSFLAMLVGLFFTGTGSIYGKRKWRGEYEMGSEKDLKKLAKEKPEPEMGETEKFLEEAEQAEEQRVELSEGMQPAEVQTSTPKTAEKVKVVKVLICPKCGAENQETDTYCFNCGKKLRLKQFKKK